MTSSIAQAEAQVRRAILALGREADRAERAATARRFPKVPHGATQADWKKRTVASAMKDAEEAQVRAAESARAKAARELAGQEGACVAAKVTRARRVAGLRGVEAQAAARAEEAKQTIKQARKIKRRARKAAKKAKAQPAACKALPKKREALKTARKKVRKERAAVAKGRRKDKDREQKPRSTKSERHGESIDAMLSDLAHAPVLRGFAADHAKRTGSAWPPGERPKKGATVRQRPGEAWQHWGGREENLAELIAWQERAMSDRDYAKAWAAHAAKKTMKAKPRRLMTKAEKARERVRRDNAIALIGARKLRKVPF